MDISGLRTKYNDKANLLLEENIEKKEPFDLFNKWFEEVKNEGSTIEPNAMCLSTATKNAIPSARFVLCKGYGKEGFKFFTHYTSRKGQELEENAHCALTFYWPVFNRSVRVEGVADKLAFSEADQYFQSRPYKSQIGALCSDQSKQIKNRNVLTLKEQELRSEFGEGEVPRPSQWGGYIVRPQSIEFWQGQTDRIHDRIRFRKPGNAEPDHVLTHPGADGWIYERLAP